MAEDVDGDEEEDEDKSACIVSSSTSSSAATFVETKSKMIGLSDQFEDLKRFLPVGLAWVKHMALGIIGMPGIGKTRLAREIYEDPEIMTHFDCRLWIRVGRKAFSRKNHTLEFKGNEKKCLIVLDDLWEVTGELSSFLTPIKEMKNMYVRILFTARAQKVRDYVSTVIPDTINSLFVRFLKEEESKELLCHKVFGENIICPYQLDKAVTKIANKCEGLPLTILTIADILSKSENRDDPEYWEDVAEERNSVFADAYNQMSKVFFPSYDYLPQCFKMPFLSLALFPRDYEIPLSKIINKLTAEGWFVDQDNQKDPERCITYCLEMFLFSHNLFLFKPKSKCVGATMPFGTIKSCRLHSAWRQLCRGEAQKNKFYHVLNRIGDASEEAIKGQRCLCLENNLLFAMTEFCSSVRLNCATSTRSLLFFGPYHQYPTPIDAVGFKLLRELNALQLRFYTFPTQVLKLVLLKYLALTCNGDLPPTIPKLFNLEVLIIHPHMSINKCCDTPPSSSSSLSSYVPVQIWDMKNLKHIEILGKSFLIPPIANSLEKVSTLVGMNAASICTILEKIPNVRKLGVQLEVTPYDDVGHSNDIILSCFPHISKLENLETFKCSIINPVVKYGYVAPFSAPGSLMLPLGLKKLHLSGMGFPWEYMDAIGSLPHLQVLKLRSYAFRGSKWETQVKSFLCVSYLVIEDSDLVEWKVASGSFPEIVYLSLKHCYKLQELCWPYADGYYGKIELVNCNPLAISCAKKLQGDRSMYPVVSTDDFGA